MLKNTYSLGGNKFAYDKRGLFPAQIDQNILSIHEGLRYRFTYRTDPIGSGEVVKILAVASPVNRGDIYPHYQWVVRSTGACKIDIYKNVTWDGIGTEVTGHTYNVNENFNDNSDVKFYTNPTNAAGTQFVWESTGSIIGGSISSETNSVGTANPKYLFVATSLAASNTISIKFLWTEENSEWAVYSSSSSSSDNSSSISSSSESSNSSYSSGSSSSSSTNQESSGSSSSSSPSSASNSSSSSTNQESSNSSSGSSESSGSTNSSSSPSASSASSSSSSVAQDSSSSATVSGSSSSSS